MIPVGITLSRGAGKSSAARDERRDDRSLTVLATRTDVDFSRRLKDLLDHGPEAGPHELALLKIGRQFRLREGVKAAIGKNRDAGAREPEDIRHRGWIFPQDSVWSA